MVGRTLINLSKQMEIARTVEVADSWIRRLRGLLGRDFLPEGHAFILYPCNSIHTSFMKFNIDVLFVNSGGKIEYIMENIPPFRVSPIIRTSRFCIELPEHTVKDTGTTVGDRINITEQVLKRP